MRKILSVLCSALLACALVPAAALAVDGAEGGGEAQPTTNKVLNVNKAVNGTEEGVTYRTIQEAINYIDTQDDKTNWTIKVAAGEYDRFTVLNGLDNLIVRAAAGANVTVSVYDGSKAPAETSGAYPDTAGVSIREASGVTLEGLAFKSGEQEVVWPSDSPVPAGAVSNYTQSTQKGDNVVVRNCSFNGKALDIGVFINTGTTKFTVTGCSFVGMKEAISMYGDGTLMGGATVTGNTFTNCSFAIHGYYGGTGDAGILTFANNTVTGNDTYSKIVIQDQTNTGAIKADVRSNTLTNAIVGLINLRESGETVSDVLLNNTFAKNSFYVEAVEPGTIEFYTTYQAPTQGNGHWELTGKEDFDVNWGKNPDGSTATIQKLVAEANASGEKTLKITGIDPDNLIKTFTWFKDGIYWVTDPDEEEPVTPVVPMDPDWDVSRSKTAKNLDENFESKVTLSLPSAEEQLVTDVVFVLDESSCSAPVKEQVSKMLGELYAQIEGTGAAVKVGAVQFRGEVTKLELTELTADTKDTVAKFMGERPATGGSNMSAGLLAGESMLDADDSVSADRKYLILVSDGITYIWDDEATSVQENLGVNFANSDTPDKPMLAGPDGWDVKHGNKYVPTDWKAHLEGVVEVLGSTVNEKSSLYDRDNPTSGKPFVAPSEKDKYASTVDVALYKSYEAYQRIASKYQHTYVVNAGVESEMSTFPFGPSFMEYLAGGKSADFSGILKEIIYLVDAGSYVEDYMGYVEGDYDFDFVNNASALSLTVGNATCEATKIGDNEYGFKQLDNGDYAYTVTYTRGNGQGEEHFTWYINEAVTNFAPVQLTYTVKLVNPKTEAGTYGTFDFDGSKGYEGLCTNKSATLYPVSTGGAEGAPLEFAKPTVSYVVNEVPAGTELPSTGGDEADAGDKVVLPLTGDSMALMAFALAAVAVCGLGVAAVAARRRRGL